MYKEIASWQLVFDLETNHLKVFQCQISIGPSHFACNLAILLD